MNKSKTCCFIGQREVTHDIRANLKEQIEKLIREGLADNFLVGHQGQFDSMVYSVLKDLKATYPQITYSIVLAYMPDEKTAGRYGDDTLYPDGLETVPKRFAISKRNEWMVRHSDYMICYVYKITGGAVKVREMAEKRGVKVVDLLLIS